MTRPGTVAPGPDALRARRLGAEPRRRGERLLPAARGGCLAVLRRAVLEEIRVLDRVQDLVQPGQRVALDMVELAEPELREAPVGDETDIALDLGRGQALHRAELEREVDEGVLVLDDGRAD